MTRRPLARTYRPQTFSAVLGQKAPVRALGRAAATGDLAAAYIFSGTRGIGKTTIARVFAKALNCEKGPAEDCCGECTPCVEIADGRSLDVLELDAATHTGIDDVRELREAAQYPPGRERYRVFIIDEAHQLSQAAWNGLLKVLEEPPSWCVFVLCTTEPHKIPPTIESRSLHFAFKSPSPEQIRAHLTEIAARELVEVEDAALDLLVKAADGSVRDGLSALDQVRAVAEGAVTAEIVREALGLVPGEAIDAYLSALADGDAEAALEVIAHLEGEGQDLRVFAAEALDRARALALSRIKSDGDELASRFATEQLVWIGRVLDETEMRLRQGGPARTLVDLATVRMSTMSNLPKLDELLGRLATPGGPGAAPGDGGTGGGARGRAAATGARTPRRRPGGRDESSRAAADGGRPQAATVDTVSAALAGSPAPAAGSRRTGAGEASGSPSPGPASPGAGPGGSLPATIVPSGAGGDATLLASLTQAVAEIRAPMAAYLGRARGAQIDNGVLTIRLPADRSHWKRKLSEGIGREVLAEAAERVTGAPPRSVRVELDGDADPSSRASEGPTREDQLAAARRDPVVKAIFDTFGAVLVEGSGARKGRSGPPPPRERGAGSRPGAAT